MSGSASGFVLLTRAADGSTVWSHRGEAGRFYGRQSLSVRDGLVSVVSYDANSREICVTTGAL
jgi:hypothetical protein